ncbi:MAG: D-alanyl-D-alanine carboxypeptidase family protein [Pseudomonadota bacterium]
MPTLARRAAFLMIVVAVMTMVTTAPADARRYAAMVVDHENGEVLFSRHPDKWVYPASLTKMMTLYLLFEGIESGKFTPATKLKVSKRAAGMPASKLGLRRGSTITVRDAVRALVVKSANDVAVVVAEAIAGSETKFAELMTKRAHQLGMASTIFRNASGLPNKAQRTTARDMIQLSRRLINDYPGYYHLFSKPTFSWDGRIYRSHNRLMASYAGMDGLKTGYIGASGFNLAASVKRGSTRLVAVVFGGKTGRSRNAHMAKILDQSFADLSTRPTFVAMPRPRPEFEALIAQAASTMEQGSNSEEPEVPSGSARVSAAATSAPVRDVPAEVVTAITRIDEMTANGPAIGVSQRRPGQLMRAEGPAISALRGGPEKSGGDGPYGVQVGAYQDPNRARQAALIASRRVPSILLQGNIDVSMLQGSRGPLYRARVIGLDLDAAQNACAILERQKRDCLVVQTRKINLASSSLKTES